MMIRIGIIGYGNLGKGVELAILNNNDMELKAIFTRRDPDNIKTITNVKVNSIEEIENWKDKIDVMILCGGSAKDLPVQTPKFVLSHQNVLGLLLSPKMYMYSLLVNNIPITIYLMKKFLDPIHMKLKLFF